MGSVTKLVFQLLVLTAFLNQVSHFTGVPRIPFSSKWAFTANNHTNVHTVKQLNSTIKYNNNNNYYYYKIVFYIAPYSTWIAPRCFTFKTHLKAHIAQTHFMHKYTCLYIINRLIYISGFNNLIQYFFTCCKFNIIWQLIPQPGSWSSECFPSVHCCLSFWYHQKWTRLKH